MERLTLSEKIRQELESRHKRGESYYAIGKASGVHQQVVARFIKGERANIRADTLDAFAAWLQWELQPIPPVDAAYERASENVKILNQKRPAKAKAASEQPAPADTAAAADTAKKKPRRKFNFHI